MRFKLDADIGVSESVNIDGVEFDIRGNKVWIQIGKNIVMVEKDEVAKLTRLFE